MKNRVLPEPDPPTTRTFLFLAYFGIFGLLLMVILSDCDRITLFANTGSSNGSISACLPHLAEPYSSLCRNFLAFFPFRYTANAVFSSFSAFFGYGDLLYELNHFCDESSVFLFRHFYMPQFKSNS